MSSNNIAVSESEDAEACFNLGVRFMEEGDYARAEACFLRTRVLAPDSLETILNLGYVFDKQGRSNEALACYNSVLAMDPDNAKARYNRAIHELRSGNLIDGFADYEARFAAIRIADSRIYAQPRWDGSPLNGRSILVYCEQGLGDAIQFSRYIPFVLKTGGRVVLEVQQPLVSFISAQSLAERVVAKTAQPPVTDCHVPLLSLPHMFGTTLETIPPPLKIATDPSKVAIWNHRLKEDTHFRIGLAWRGSASNPMDGERSCPLGELAPLLAMPGISFYTLQLDGADEIAAVPQAAGLIDLTGYIDDFSDTAALVANLDMVISVDTAVVHLAASMGKPVWTLLAHTPDWRWMSQRNDSPWYPSVTLFRQPQPGEWQSVIKEVAAALRNRLLSQEDEAAGCADMMDEAFQQALADIDNSNSDAAISALNNLLLNLPDDPAVWFHLGRAYDQSGQLSEAERAYRMALQENTCSPAAWFALGELRLKQKAYSEAEFCLRKAHMLNPQSVDILMSLGSTLSAQCKTADALDLCRKILAIKPDCVDARYNMSFIQLRDGNYKEGFANFEARLDIEKFDIDFRLYQQPRWDGSPLSGRSILVYGEQGLGDVIQFARYIPLVAQQGGKVVFEVDPPLIPLFESLPGVDRIIRKSKEPPLTDVYIQLLSLPYLFGTTLDTVPARIPYIAADADKAARWKQRLGSSPALRVGLVWRGNPKNPRDKERSCPLNTFAPLGDLSGVEFYSLQVGDAAAEVSTAPEGLQLTDFSTLLTDLTETAALIANLDLLISVDTAVAHLAGAMGQQVWVVLPTGSEWRWLKGRSDTPWYPTMRVFEHDHNGRWEAVIHRVKGALEKLLLERDGCADNPDIEKDYEDGVRLKEAGNLAGAENSFRRIVAQHPELPDPQYSLGVVLQLQGRLQEAIGYYQNAIDLDPVFVKAHYNLANVYLRCGLYQEAMASATAAINCDPGHADAHWLLGMLQLQRGDFISGWREYEWRWKAHGFTSIIPELGRPLWDGSPLEGKTLLIHMEQGRGDMIQFIRYAPLAAALGGRIVICAVSELVPLLATVEGVSQVVDRNGVLPGFDVHIPVQSLPYVLNTTLETVPSHTPYIFPDPAKMEKWRQLVAPEGVLRVGLAWQGSTEHIDDHNRSCPFNELLPLLDIVGVAYYSLQLGFGSEQLMNNGGGASITDLTDRIQDFSDTAAFIANLDLVISVDTAVAHLAGALGKKVWLMLPYLAEWRWMLDREDSPWYPEMRLFRQASQGGWSPLVERIGGELASMAGSADYFNQKGIRLLQHGCTPGAELAFNRSLSLNPGSAETWCNLGVAMASAGRYADAIASYREALSIKPDFIQALFNMGNAYSALDNLDAARACYQQTVYIKPDYMAAYICLGETAKRQGHFEQARADFESALSLDHDCADAWQGVAETLQAQNEFAEAIITYKKVLALEPDRAKTWNILGTVYHSIEQLDDAEACYRKSLALLPDCTTVLNNLGVVFNAQGRLEEALAVYRHLLQVDNNYAEGHWNLSVALLAMGQYPEGWREYEWRFTKTDPVALRDFSQPRWDGSDLQGRTILLHAEQGFGDTIQFARYATLVAQRGARVILECQVPGLRRLLHSLEGVVEVVVAGENLPSFDCHLPLMSLPLLFGTALETIPANIPYLSAERDDVDVWQQRLGKAAAFRVGLVWFAKQSQLLNRKRSCHLEEFRPLLNIPGVEFFSLQIGLGAEQLTENSGNFPIKDFTCHIKDFADTAAFMANLDLVITIDTAAAHLAGALGVNTWVLLPYVAEWRWLCQRQDSPWYPTMRLFRQPCAGDWPAMMASAAEALNETVKTTSGLSCGTQSHSTLRVGLAWSGRQDNPLNRKRSCPFALLKPLFDLQDITFFSLQMNPAEILDKRLIDLSEQISNFEDTAALMAGLDLIISIDTSVAHLAAATGRPTWVLLSHVSDWRWGPDRHSSAWYPDAELFRQPDHGDWESVVRNVVNRLKQLSGKTCPETPFNSDVSDYSHSHERLLLEQILEDKRQEMLRNTASPDAHLDVGAALALLGRDDAAVESFRHVLELDPEHVTGHLNLAYSLLSLGEYTEGWEHLEWRLKRLPPDALPPWPLLDRNSLGTHPAGTKVLVHCEQGYGDTIQFARFLPMLAGAGYVVVVSCQPPMAELVASLPDVSMVVPHGEQLPDCDLQVLLLSLPWLFSVTRETLPACIPYLRPGARSVETWEKWIEEK